MRVRQSAVIAFSAKGFNRELGPVEEQYSVQFRDRAFWWPWFGSWRWVVLGNDKQLAFPYPLARFYADQILTHGVVPSLIYSSQCHPIIEKDDEKASET